MKYLIEDILTFTYERKMIFGGRIQKFNQKLKDFYGKKRLVFGSMELDKSN